MQMAPARRRIQITFECDKDIKKILNFDRQKIFYAENGIQSIREKRIRESLFYNFF